MSPSMAQPMIPFPAPGSESQNEPSFRTYEEAERYLAEFTDYERMVKGTHYPDDLFDLRRIEELLKRVGDPHRQLRGLHIAGTKGKGSTAVFADVLLRAHGLVSGLYTSPHLVDKEERIQVQGEPLRKREFLAWMNVLGPSLKALKDSALAPTFFDIMTTVCFLHFRSRGVEASVLEVGLGGRLDSTNVFVPQVCLITRLGMDHMEKLGNTLASIAAEKAGIVKKNVPVVSLAQEPEAEAVLRARCAQMEAPLYWVGDEIRVEEDQKVGKRAFCVRTPGGVYPALELAVLGRHQRLNAAAAIAGVELFLNRSGKRPLESDRVRRALRQVRIPGRIDVLGTNPLWVVDGAHNPLSIETLIRTVRGELEFQDLHVLFACSRDKPIREMLALLAPETRRWTLTGFDFPRIEDPEIVRQWLDEIDPGAACTVTRSPDEALKDAFARSGPKDCILCCGSFYLVGEIFKRVDASKRVVRT